MSFNKQDIYKALETITAPGEGKSLIENNNVTNVVTFGDEVIVDVIISNPTLQAKKKIELEITKAIQTTIDKTINVKINVKVEKPAPKGAVKLVGAENIDELINLLHNEAKVI